MTDVKIIDIEIPKSIDIESLEGERMFNDQIIELLDRSLAFIDDDYSVETQEVELEIPQDLMDKIDEELQSGPDINNPEEFIQFIMKRVFSRSLTH